MDVVKYEIELLQREEDQKAREAAELERCPSGGQNVGLMLEIPGSDEWNIQCPTCRTWWAGGSTLLEDHQRR